MFAGRSAKGKSSPELYSTLSWALILIVAVSCLARGSLENLTPPEPPQADSYLAVFPEAARAEETRVPFFHYRAFDSTGRYLGVIIITDMIPPAVRGYLGQVGSAAGVTVEGRITRVIPVRHRETPYYMGIMADAGFWDELAGLDLAAPFPDLDTVSGATVSSRAVIRDVREASSLAARTLFHIEVPAPAATDPNPWTSWKSLLVLLLLSVSLMAGFLREQERLRQAVMLANLIGVGFWLNTPLTLSSLSRTLTLNIPGPGNTLLILLLLYILLSVPLQGRAYCRLVCPFGTLQHLANRISPRQFNLPTGVAVFLPAFRRLVLGLLLFLAVWAGWEGFTEVEPFFSLFSLRLSPLLWVMVIFILMTAVFIRRFWCNAMCPTGTMLSVMSRLCRPRKGKTDETV